MNFPFFDTHFHYYNEEPAAAYYKRAADAGVSWLMAAGASHKDSLVARDFAAESERVWFSAGVHPHEAAQPLNKPVDFEIFRHEPKLAAIGEIGLDYNYEHAPRKTQQKVFEQFLELAIRWQKPAIIHCRDKEAEEQAYADTYPMLRSFASAGGSFVLHCFTGTPAWAEKFLEEGAYLGITGIVTFPKAGNVRETLKVIPLSRLLLETDAPYLAPIPQRGKKNHPEFLPLLAARVALEKALPLEELARITTENAFAFFRIDHK
ncbi:MAG: hypothetical protein A2X49_14630 [Lentisphaerae bacterium GWF2_52_8]|nr:MAG: hypothetical protein A2X49_14630 [Lentisphaerae bacterium GWF2_52_8]